MGGGNPGVRANMVGRVRADRQTEGSQGRGQREGVAGAKDRRDNDQISPIQTTGQGRGDQKPPDLTSLKR